MEVAFEPRMKTLVDKILARNISSATLKCYNSVVVMGRVNLTGSQGAQTVGST